METGLMMSATNRSFGGLYGDGKRRHHKTKKEVIKVKGNAGQVSIKIGHQI
jgi:hypothetical protein